MEPEEFAVI